MKMRLLCMLSVLLVTACAPRVETQKRFLWPIGSPQPKIEYMQFFAADSDILPEQGQFSQALLGVSPGVALFSSPRGIDIDATGVLAVADVGKHRVVLCDPGKREIRTLLDSYGEVVYFPMPMGVAFDAAGGGYVSDTSTGRVYRFNAAGVVVGEFGQGELSRPNGMVYDAGTQQLYVVDTLHHQVAVYSAAGQLLRRIGKRGNQAGEFNFPLDIDLGPGGELVVLDALNSRVQIFDADGNFLRMFGERGTALGSFMLPKSVAVDRFGHIYVTDSRAHRFVIFDMHGEFLLTIGGRSVVVGGAVHPGGFDFPQGVATDGKGGIFVVDSLSRLVHKFQYLSAEYLQQRPIRPGDVYFPQHLGR